MIASEDIVEIIQKKLEGTGTPAELDRLNKWLEDSANATVYAQFKELWDSTTAIANKQETFTPNTAKSWQAIEQHIIADKPTRSFKIAYGVAASVALVMMLFGANYLFNTSNNSGNIQYVLQTNEKDTLTFSDGSQAYVFGPCSMSYPEEFAADERIISMDGFVYFDIAHDETRPFEINTTNGKVEVLGTSFTVDTRQKEIFTVQCLSGKVRVTGTKNSNKCETLLTKNKQATYTSQTKQLAVTSFESSNLSIEIPIHNFIFTNKPLGEILERIEYNFGVSIQLENKNLLTTKYSTSLNDTTIDEFFNELKITFKVKIIQTKPSTYIIKGGSSN